MSNSELIRETILKAGGAIKVAAKAKIKRTSVYKWIYSAQVPADQVTLLSTMSGVPREKIRPDIFQEQQKSPS